MRCTSIECSAVCSTFLLFPRKIEYITSQITHPTMNIDTLVSMMLAPILIKLAEQFIEWLTSNLRAMYDRVVKRFSKATVSIISKQHFGTAREVMSFFSETHDSAKLITCITAELISKGCTVNTSQAKYIGGVYNTIADGTIYYKGYSFTYTSGVQIITADTKYNEDKLVIKHSSAKKIRAFIDKCNAIIDKQSDMSYTQTYFGQTKNDKGHTIFDPLVFTATTTFDDIFFPEKSTVVQSVDKLIAGSIPKLSFYLHGEPGCGKSSLIKAIAAKTGYSIIEIKLSFIENDNELRNIIFGKTVHVTRYGIDDFYKIDVKRRIYLFEDIDAECDVVYRRELQKEKKQSAEVSTDTDGPKCDKNATAVKESKKQSLTLSGILNVLDGVLALSGIVIMTTNHPEKLDPALVRFGRVTHNIRMERLTSDCANMLVRKFHKEWSGRVPDGKYTPAELEAICQTNSLRDVARIVSAESV